MLCWLTMNIVSTSVNDDYVKKPCAGLRQLPRAAGPGVVGDCRLKSIYITILMRKVTVRWPPPPEHHEQLGRSLRMGDGSRVVKEQGECKGAGQEVPCTPYGLVMMYGSVCCRAQARVTYPEH